MGFADRAREELAALQPSEARNILADLTERVVQRSC
jgi:hypothetical protein